jgi:hypothetical protein
MTTMISMATAMEEKNCVPLIRPFGESRNLIMRVAPFGLSLCLGQGAVKHLSLIRLWAICGQNSF